MAFKIVGDVSVSGTGELVLAAAVFSLLNIFLKPILMLLGLPFRIITLGLVTFLINMAMVRSPPAWLLSGVDVGGFINVAEITIVVWIVNMVLHGLGVGGGSSSKGGGLSRPSRSPTS